MKKIASIIFCCAASQLMAQNNPIFYGGSGDGLSTGNFAQLSNDSRFYGGNGDGMNTGSYTPQSTSNALGGNGDGINTGSYTQQSTSNALGGNGDGIIAGYYIQSSVDDRFLGGNGDGLVFTNAIQGSIDDRFFGGNGDGINVGVTTQASIDARFLGGPGDGWAYVFFPMGPLPLELLSFTAKDEQGVHVLSWSTAAEINMSHFVIEHSTTSQQFLELGMRNAKQGSTSNQYEFANHKPVIGNNFYRLKIVNSDGTYKYSNTVLLEKLADGGAVLLYPNPTANVLNITVQHNEAKDVWCEVYSGNGSKIFEEKWNTSNATTQQLNVSNWSSGYYFVKLKVGSQLQVLKVLKQ